MNTTENQVAAQVTAEPVEHTASSTGEQKQPRRRTTTRRPAGEGRTNHDGESTNRPRRNANNRTNTNGGSTATRRTNTRRNAESGEGTERKPRQTRAPRGEHGENTRNTRTNRTRNGQNQNRSERTNRSANRNNHHDQGEQIELIGRTPNGANKGKFQIIPLGGGLGEIGKNMTVFQYEDEIIVLDSGLAFPSEDMLGVDIVIPDMSYIIENKDRVKAVVITHGHEDHIGSLAYLMKEISCPPVYATNLVCGLIEGKFKEHKVSPKCLRTIAAGDEVQIGQVKVGFIQTNHSIPDSCAVYFDTPIGTVLHTGDFKIDQTPVDGRLMDMHKFAELGNKGVLALLSDSTNVEKPGTTGSESSVGPAIKQLSVKRRAVSYWRLSHPTYPVFNKLSMQPFSTNARL